MKIRAVITQEVVLDLPASADTDEKIWYILEKKYPNSEISWTNEPETEKT